MQVAAILAYLANRVSTCSNVASPDFQSQAASLVDDRVKQFQLRHNTSRVVGVSVLQQLKSPVAEVLSPFSILSKQQS